MRQFILLLNLLIVATIFIGCPRFDLCGEGDYQAQWVKSTVPMNHPVRYDADNEILLFESGTLVVYPFGPYSKSQIDLEDLCGTTDIRDIGYYNQNLLFDDFSTGHIDSLEFEQEDYFIIVLARDRCCKLNSNYDFLFNFGNSGLGPQTIVDGIAVEINNLAEIFVIDRGDNSIKKYDLNGQYLARWSNIGEPLHLKIYDGFVYILDQLSSTIKKYDYNGNYVATVLDDSFYLDISYFDIPLTNSFRIIDDNGSRISDYYSNGRISEIKTEYCLDNNYFQFGRLVSTDNGFYAFYIVDCENNDIIKFKFTKYRW